ncbi:hypothetical protein [Nostoc sp.]|uniref:hypothetical protein n=1 Tax=Nostoc sp. TaxID=1180 RepID=UPI003FA58D60
MEPVNFAEVIAQIDVETERLGWTTEQRREHLKKTYGKRSHHLLVYKELLDFLQYLISQPTPTLHEILIAKINVETERLGWTTEQGREHVIKNYGKRSRTLLTEVQLLDFLQYLVSQPLPTLDEVLIAKINVEMQRLGWTTKQGREHVTKNYGKRSRFLLTDEQLHEFLQYLESQPLDEVVTAKINVDIEQLCWTQQQGQINTEIEQLCWMEEEEQKYVITTSSKQSKNLPNGYSNAASLPSDTYSQDLGQNSPVTANRELEFDPPVENLEITFDNQVENQTFPGISANNVTPFTPRTYSPQENVSTPSVTGKRKKKAEPVDLSDVIAQTDVELQRLGWTPEQGREHLIETYGKRGRTLLTEEELHEFLKYLQSQPDPIAGF